MKKKLARRSVSYTSEAKCLGKISFNCNFKASAGRPEKWLGSGKKCLLHMCILVSFCHRLLPIFDLYSRHTVCDYEWSMNAYKYAFTLPQCSGFSLLHIWQNIFDVSAISEQGTPWFEPGTCWSAVSRSNHWAMYPGDIDFYFYHEPQTKNIAIAIYNHWAMYPTYHYCSLYFQLRR